MAKAYCPNCGTKLVYCGGDVHLCRKCNIRFMTDYVLDKEGYYLLRRCDKHGLETGGTSYVGEVPHCIKCGRHLLKVKPDRANIREIRIQTEV